MRGRDLKQSIRSSFGLDKHHVRLKDVKSVACFLYKLPDLSELPIAALGAGTRPPCRSIKVAQNLVGARNVLPKLIGFGGKLVIMWPVPSVTREKDPAVQLLLHCYPDES